MLPSSALRDLMRNRNIAAVLNRSPEGPPTYLGTRPYRWVPAHKYGQVPKYMGSILFLSVAEASAAAG